MRVTTAIMSAGNTPVLSLLCLAGFLWLGHLANRAENLKTLAEYGLSEESAERYDPSEKRVASKSAKPSLAAQALALRDVWGLTDADISAEVDLFNEKGQKQ